MIGRPCDLHRDYNTNRFDVHRYSKGHEKVNCFCETSFVICVVIKWRPSIDASSTSKRGVSTPAAEFRRRSGSRRCVVGEDSADQTKDVVAGSCSRLLYGVRFSPLAPRAQFNCCRKHSGPADAGIGVGWRHTR